jgi:hypothetical protein
MSDEQINRIVLAVLFVMTVVCILLAMHSMRSH